MTSKPVSSAEMESSENRPGGDFGTEEEENIQVITVDWDGPDDPANPKNWSFKRKWGATAIISAYTFISPLSSTMVAPATAQIVSEFHISNSVTAATITSIFVLAYAVGPLVFAPLSEIYGRSRVVQLSNMIYLVWNIACGLARNDSELIVFRFLAGIGGSAPLAIGAGMLGDCWKQEQRGQAMALYTLGPLLGPAIGPLAGAWIAEKASWRWVFWSTSIADGVVQVFGLFFLRETFPPVLLERKARAMREEHTTPGTVQFRTPFHTSLNRSLSATLHKALTRPFKLFISEPIIQVLGLYMALVYGLIYLVCTSIPLIYGGGKGSVYNENTGIAGLHYLALGLGLSIAAQVGARLGDRVYVYCTKKYGVEGEDKDGGKGKGKPEYRLPNMIPGTFALPAGLLIMGWCAQLKGAWIGTDIGIALVGRGMTLNFQAIQTYVVDAFTLHAASAIAAVSCLRSLAGFGFPLFAPPMYAALGYGVSNTILAAIAIVLGCPAPWVLWAYGARLRGRSRWVASAGGVHV